MARAPVDLFPVSLARTTPRSAIPPRAWRRSLFLRTLALPGAVAMLLAGAAGPAFAQQQEPEAEGVIATAPLDTITVTPTLQQERTIDTLAAVSVVGPEQFDLFNPSTTQDVFFGMPGTSAVQNGNSPQASINIRGMQDFGRVAVYIDGAPQNFTQLGHGSGAGSFFLEPALLTSVDVVRGPFANIYGSGAIGGVVSFRTKDVQDVVKPGQTWGTEISGDFGSNGPMGLGTIFTGAHIGQNVDVFLGGTYRYQEDYSDGNGDVVPSTGSNIWTGIAKLTVRPVDHHEIKFTALNYDAEYDTNNAALVSGAIPGTATQYSTTVLNQTLTANWNYSNPDDNLFDWKSTVYWNRVKQEQTKFAGTASAITGAIGDPRSFTITTTGFDANNTSKFEVLGMRHAVTIGGDYYHDDVDNVDNYGFGEGYNPSGSRDIGGAFVQLKSAYSTWLETVAAVRYDSYQISGDGVSNSGDRFSPKVTVGLTPWSWLTVYGTYAEAYRAPAVTETLVSGAHPPAIPLVFCPDGSYGVFCFVPNPNLRPEVGKNKEVGINLKYDNLFTTGDKFRAKLNFYQNDVDDYIELVGYDPGRYGYANYQYQNVSSARIRGFELESNYEQANWFLGFNATVSEGTNQENGQPLTSIMPNNVAFTVGTRLADDKLTLAVRWQWVAAKTLADLPTDSPYGATPSFNLVNAYLTYKANEWVTASFSLENLLNEQYTQYQQFLPSAGITFKGGLRVRFGGGEVAQVTPAVVK